MQLDVPLAVSSSIQCVTLLYFQSSFSFSVFEYDAVAKLFIGCLQTSPKALRRNCVQLRVTAAALFYLFGFDSKRLLLFFHPETVIDPRKTRRVRSACGGSFLNRTRRRKEQMPPGTAILDRAFPQVPGAKVSRQCQLIGSIGERFQLTLND